MPNRICDVICNDGGSIDYLRIHGVNVYFYCYFNMAHSLSGILFYFLFVVSFKVHIFIRKISISELEFPTLYMCIRSTVTKRDFLKKYSTSVLRR